MVLPTARRRGNNMQYLVKQHTTTNKNVQPGQERGKGKGPSKSTLNVSKGRIQILDSPRGPGVNFEAYMQNTIHTSLQI